MFRTRPDASLAALLAAVAAACAAPPEGQRAISVACGSVGVEFEACKQGAEAWARSVGRPVRVVSTPRGSNETLALYQQLLAARSGDLDVLRVDVVWPALLARDLADLGPAVAPEALGDSFPVLRDAGVVDGRLVALPWFADVGVLYYRKDLLARYGRPAPATWQELTETAKLVQEGERRAGRSRTWGFVFQGRAYEGLTCNALEWLHAFGGGTIVDARGDVTVANPRAVRALELAASWVRTISPEGVLDYAEEEARAVFQSGDAVFMRNWPYASALADAPDSPVRGKVGVAPLPRGDPEGDRGGALGGWLLAVNRHSRDVGAATRLAVHLTGRAQQKRAALAAGLNPTLPALYRDPELLRADPLLRELAGMVASGVARPARATRGRYNQVSATFWSAVHEVLAGEVPAREGLQQAARRLERIRRGGRW